MRCPVLLWHNQLRDVIVDANLGLGVKVEAGSASHPADALVNNWISGILAAFDITVSISSHTSVTS